MKKTIENPFTSWKSPRPSLMANDLSHQRSQVAQRNPYKFTPAPLKVNFNKKKD